MHLASSFQILGLLSGLLSLIFYIVFFRSEKVNHLYLGRIFKVAMFFFIATTVLTLFYYIITDDFNLLYVYLYSDRTLPFIYKISVLWAGQSGSLLVTSLVLLFFSLIEDFRIKNNDKKYVSLVNSIQLSFIIIFLLSTVFVVKPFVELDFNPVNGEGLMPALQNKYIFLTPLFTCLWLVSAFILISHTFSSLILRNTTFYWINESRIWVYISFFSLVGVLFSSSLWSFNNSGIFWNWSILEIILIIGFISIIAFIHTSFMYRTKNRFKFSSYLWVLLFFQSILFYLYMIYGTSVNIVSPYKYAFSGNYILFIIFLFSFAYVFLLFINRKEIILSKYLKLSFDNLLFKLMNFYFFLLVLFIFAGILFQLSIGIKIDSSAYYITVIKITSLLFIVAIISLLIYQKISKKNKIYLVIKKNKGSFLSHISIVIIILITFMSYKFHYDSKILININETLTIKNLNIHISDIKSIQKDNYVSTYANVSLFENQKMIGSIYPEIRGYNNFGYLTAETKSIRYGLGIISVAFIRYDFKNKVATIFIMVRPYVLLVIPVLFLLILGLFMTLKKDGYY